MPKRGRLGLYHKGGVIIKPPITNNNKPAVVAKWSNSPCFKSASTISLFLLQAEIVVYIAYCKQFSLIMLIFKLTFKKDIFFELGPSAKMTFSRVLKSSQGRGDPV